MSEERERRKRKRKITSLETDKEGKREEAIEKKKTNKQNQNAKKNKGKKGRARESRACTVRGECSSLSVLDPCMCPVFFPAGAEGAPLFWEFLTLLWCFCWGVLKVSFLPWSPFTTFKKSVWIVPLHHPSQLLLKSETISQSYGRIPNLASLFVEWMKTSYFRN